MCKHILIREFKSEDSELIKEFISRSTSENDGYGAIIRTTENEIVTLKSLEVGAFYLEIGQWMQSGQVQDLVIHHRMSTNFPGIDYAHPFEFQGQYMTHNGVVNTPKTKAEPKTKNDSEALLLHLVESNYDTKVISGYFSCFILNDSETIVLVDDIAPIYSNGRIYSSHRLVDSWDKLTLSKIVHSAGEVSIQAIETTKSEYGSSHKKKSLGYSRTYDYDDNVYDFKYNNQDDFDYFMDCLNSSDISYIIDSKDNYEMRKEIESICEMLDIKLTDSQIELAIDYFGRLTA